MEEKTNIYVCRERETDRRALQTVRADEESEAEEGLNIGEKGDKAGHHLQRENRRETKRNEEKRRETERNGETKRQRHEEEEDKENLGKLEENRSSGAGSHRFRLPATPIHSS